MQLSGKCPCGKVAFTATEAPVFQGYCHCESCQRAQAAPMLAFALFPAQAVTIEGDTTALNVSGSDGAAIRLSCAACGTRVANEPGGGSLGLRALFPSLFDQHDWFKPTMHIFCEDRMVDVSDELPKYLDTPEQFGGSGRTL